MSQPGTIALIGYRGCGKTVVGRALAAQLGGTSVDTDALVVERAGLSIALIFAEQGEARFRDYEAAALREALAARPAVVSLGGGAILREDNVQLLRTSAYVVWLTAPVAVLAARVMADEATAEQRPALTPAADVVLEVAQVLAQREPRYAAVADLVVDTVGRSPAEIARAILGSRPGQQD